jgi:hypothetical protein
LNSYMEKTNELNSIQEMFWDFWHYKLVHEPVLKDDSITADLFKSQINEPFELYEKYIRSIEVEKRVAFIACVSDEQKKAAFDELGTIDGVEQKIFVGDYEDRKKEIKYYLDEMGFSHLKLEESVGHPNPKVTSITYHCNVYGIEHMLGFYLKREGLLRGCMGNGFGTGTSFASEICGKREDFESIGKFLDKEYIQLLYGAEAWEKAYSYYRKNFLDSFVHGESFAYLNTGSLRGGFPVNDEEAEDEDGDEDEDGLL